MRDEDWGRPVSALDFVDGGYDIARDVVERGIVDQARETTADVTCAVVADGYCVGACVVLGEVGHPFEPD